MTSAKVIPPACAAAAAGQQNTADSLDTAIDDDETHRELMRVSANFRLMHARQRHPELSHAEAIARLDLAAAIIAMDAVDERIEAGEKIHSINEQAAVEYAQQAYTQALADLVRGEAG